MTITPPLLPMAAQSLERLPAPGALPGGMVFEPKYDGYRMLVFAHRGEVFLQSRHGRERYEAGLTARDLDAWHDWLAPSLGLGRAMRS
ncbi:hypothetical protein ABZY19_37015 [Streptomyces sp. NPDC006475]|uniref:hypothetical protein n=1 Tax=Streptomyces sp. NPDC006475 TaxID=3155719 RepID=UPI0033BD92AB